MYAGDEVHFDVGGFGGAVDQDGVGGELAATRCGLLLCEGQGVDKVREDARGGQEHDVDGDDEGGGAAESGVGPDHDAAGVGDAGAAVGDGELAGKGFLG